MVVVDHSRKNRPEGQSLSSADIFGPYTKWAAAEHIVMTDLTQGDDHRLELFIESKDTETARLFLVVSPKGSSEEKFAYAGSVENVAEKSRETGNQNRARVLQAVERAMDKKQGARVSSGEIVAALAESGQGLSRGTVIEHLGALAETGLVDRIGEGRFTSYGASLGKPA